MLPIQVEKRACRAKLLQIDASKVVVMEVYHTLYTSKKFTFLKSIFRHILEEPVLALATMHMYSCGQIKSKHIFC